MTETADLLPAETQTLTLLIGFGRPMTAAAVGAARGTTRTAAQQHLRNLLQVGLVERRGRDARSPLYLPTAVGRSLPLEGSAERPDPCKQAKTRTCLGPCRRPFWSSWAGERICPSCKSLAGWQSGLGFE